MSTEAERSFEHLLGSATGTITASQAGQNLEVILPYTQDLYNYISRIVVHIRGFITTEGSAALSTSLALLHGQVYIQNGLIHTLLDKGYIRATGSGGTTGTIGSPGLNSTIGIIGVVPYTNGDKVVVSLSNYSGAAPVADLEVFGYVSHTPIPAGFTRLHLEEYAIWIYRAVITQANIAGGAIVLDLVPALGDEFIPLWVEAVNSGTNTLQIGELDEDNNIHLMVAVASAAASSASIPRASQSDSADSARTGYPYPIPIRGHASGAVSHGLTIRQTGAGAQNDTLTIQVRGLVKGRAPSVGKDRSTNQADVTIATPTINRLV